MVNKPEFLDRVPGIVPDTYVSFAGDPGFLGAVVVAEPDHAKALGKIKAQGLDPGGQAMCFSVPPGMYPRDRLLSRTDLDAATGNAHSTLGEAEAEDGALAERIARASTVIDQGMRLPL